MALIGLLPEVAGDEAEHKEFVPDYGLDAAEHAVRNSVNEHLQQEEGVADDVEDVAYGELLELLGLQVIPERVADHVQHEEHSNEPGLQGVVVLQEIEEGLLEWRDLQYVHEPVVVDFLVLEGDLLLLELAQKLPGLLRAERLLRVLRLHRLRIRLRWLLAELLESLRVENGRQSLLSRRQVFHSCGLCCGRSGAEKTSASKSGKD